MFFTSNVWLLPSIIKDSVVEKCLKEQQSLNVQVVRVFIQEDQGEWHLSASENYHPEEKQEKTRKIQFQEQVIST